MLLSIHTLLIWPIEGHATLYQYYHTILLSCILNKSVKMKDIIVFLSGRVFVGSLKGFADGWVGSEQSFRRKD